VQRRDFLKMAALSGLLSGQPRLISAMQQKSSNPDAQVNKVLLVTKCHFDAGFALTQRDLLREYFEIHYPAAIQVTKALRDSGQDRYVWTTGSWLLYEYLEQATAPQRRTMEDAVSAGDIAWHALPFTWQTEMLDRSMIEGSLGFSAELDRRFGRQTTGAKMTDVPGHSIGIVAPLEAHGIRVLDIGVNSASTPPDVPDLFLWNDSHGHSVAVLYHRHDYGSTLEIPGTGIAVDIEVRADNSGPHTIAEIQAMYAKLRTRYPGAEIVAATMNDVAAAVDQARNRLPVVTGEVGDTWIYGCGSDPIKVARYREVARLRQEWLQKRRFATGDSTDRELLRRLLLAVEHTWGTDTKTYLDTEHYRPRDLAAVLRTPGYQVMEVSWREKLDNIDAAVASLPADLRVEADARLSELNATRPITDGMRVLDPSKPFNTRHFMLTVDPRTGAIVRLRNRRSGREWASVEHPLALFTYQTLSATDYSEFFAHYITVQADWVARDYGKPNIDKFNAISREWHPRLVHCWEANTASEDRIVLELAIDDEALFETGNVTWPKEIFVEARMPADQPYIDLRLTSLDKGINRMPEAMWLTFSPCNAHDRGWNIQKVGLPLSPFDVVRGGGRAMHAISDAVNYKDASGHAFSVHSFDAPVLALGERTPLNFSVQQPALSTGIHFNLFNNAWGTNYPQWRGGNWAYRFRIRA